MSRVRTSPLSVPLPTGGARQALGLSGDISRATSKIVTALDRNRQTVNRRKMITAETEWLGFLANAQDEVTELDPDDRLTSFQAQAKEFGKSFNEVKDGTLRKNMELGFARDSARTEVHVQRDARKAEVAVSNAALEKYGGELRAEVLRGTIKLQTAMDKFGEKSDLLVNHSHDALQSAQKKQAFAIGMVRTQFGRIKTSGELSATGKYEMIRQLLDSDLAAENMDAGEMATKRQESINILIQEAHRLMNIASTAVVLPDGGSIIDAAEDAIRNMPDVIGSLKAVGVANVQAAAQRRNAIDVDAQVVAKQFSLDKPLDRPWSPSTMNAAFELMQDNADATMDKMGAWFARGVAGFPEAYKKAYRNLWDADSVSFNMETALDTYRAIAAVPGGKNRIDQMLRATDMNEVAQTTVRMIASDPGLEPQILKMMSQPGAKATLQQAASDIQDPALLAPFQQRDDIDAVYEGVGDVMANREAREDWRAGLMFNMLSRSESGDVFDPANLRGTYKAASRFGAENLKKRWQALDFDFNFWDFVLVPNGLDTSPAMTAFLNEHANDGVMNTLMINVGDANKKQLLPFTQNGRVTAIVSWDPATGTGEYLQPGHVNWNEALETVIPDSKGLERDQWYPYMKTSSHQGDYMWQADPELAKKLWAQAKADLISQGTMSPDEATARAQVVAMADLIARSRQWSGVINPEPAGAADTE